MKRIVLYIGILVLVFAAPVKPVDIGDLRPVQILSVYKERNRVVVETDTEDRGVGATLEKALQNMKDTSLGVIYLDTADYLLVTEDTEGYLEELREVLKPSVRVCMATKKLDLRKAVSYLQTHGDLPRLKGWKKGVKLPVLSTFQNS